MTSVYRFRSRGLKYSQWLSISCWGFMTLFCPIAILLTDLGTMDLLFTVVILLVSACLLYDTLLDAFRWFEIRDLGTHWGIRNGAARRTRNHFTIQKSSIATAHVALTENVHGSGDGSEHVRIVIEPLPFAKTTKDFHLGERFHLPRSVLEEICSMLNEGRAKS